MTYLEIWNEHAMLREGKKLFVYLDSVGKPTAGIGHLLTPSENKRYSVDDPVSNELVMRWFKADSAKATVAAKKQAAEMGNESDWFIAALISVNFQLGDKWAKKFIATYPAIVQGDFDKAIKNLYRSKWYRQTPTRVDDFIAALERVRDFKDRPVTKTRTIQGASIAGSSLVASEVVAEISQQIEPLIGYSDIIKFAFLALALVGIGLTVYARLDDRKEGLR